VVPCKEDPKNGPTPGGSKGGSQTVSIKIMGRIWAQSSRKDGELLVMLALGDFANDAGESGPSLNVLAQKARITVGQLSRVLNNLEGAGEIRRQRSTGVPRSMRS